MRIISKFKDYYDIGLAQGIDEDRVFVRETKERNHPNTGWKYFPGYWAHSLRHEYRASVVGFCGMLYPLIEVKHKLDKHPWTETHHFFYSWDDFIGCMDSLKVTRELRKQVGRYKRLFQGDFWEKIRKHFEEPHAGITELFLEHRVPILWSFLVGDRDHYLRGTPKTRETTLNPCLKDIEFYKVVDPYTAFQEISMYLGGVLGDVDPNTVTVADEHRYAGHGYDKGSFRQPKGSKPNRKSRRR